MSPCHPLKQARTNQPRGPRAVAPRLAPGAHALALALLLASLSACGSLPARTASFRAHPSSVAAGDLRGPYRGRVVDASSGAPVADALLYATWTMERGYGMSLPAGAREYVGNTDANGYYLIPATQDPGQDVRITDFDLVIYKRGYVAYRSDRRFSDLGPRRDFAQLDQVVELEPWREDFSHARHLRYIGGGEALRALTAEEAEAAAIELASASDEAIATPLVVPQDRARLAAAQLLTGEDVTSVTGFDGSFESGPLGDEPDTEVYSSQHLRAMNLPETYDVALRVWRERPEAAEARYQALLDSLPGADEIDEIGDRSLRAAEGSIFGIGFVDRSRGVVALLTCGQSQCDDLEVAARLGARIHERLRARVAPRPSTASPSPTPPPPPTPDADAAPARQGQTP